MGARAALIAIPVLLITLYVAQQPSAISQLYVATTGSDVTGDGTQGNPWATVQHAVDQIVARRLNIGMSTDIQIRVGSGSYFDTNVTITDAANPTNGHTIKLTNQSGLGTVRLIGGHQVV